ncbi:MAG TPA: hypothetical protein VFL83_01525 [Anaeromyxobacter sp.]|nr:hypothetical protein [Anaeromyxobacter sp.]
MSRKKRIDDLMEAITFAEAGELETARDVAAEVFAEPPAAGERILAVSGARGFSRRMIEDSIGMAERLGYGIVALTVSPAVARLLARLEGRGARLGPDAFRARAAERGIPFAHAARGGDPEQAIADVTRRSRRIAFLLVDPGIVAKRKFARVDVPIFYLADA